MSRLLYVCNAGVLIESAGKKILVDVLNDNSQTVYRDIAPRSLKALLHGKPPYDAVDALCVTHWHPDHCNTDTLAAFTQRFPETPVVCGHELASALRSRAHGAGTVVLTDPTPGNSLTVRVADMNITTVNLQHDGNRYQAVENLAFVLHLEHSFILTGDAAPSDRNLDALQTVLAPHGKDRRVLLAPFPYLTLPAAFARVQSTLSPEHFMALHLPCPDQDDGQWIASARTALRKRGDPDGRIRLLEREGEWVELSDI